MDRQRTSAWIVRFGAMASWDLGTIGLVAATIRERTFWPRTWHLALTVATLISCWLLIQTVFAFHYARR